MNKYLELAKEYIKEKIGDDYPVTESVIKEFARFLDSHDKSKCMHESDQGDWYCGRCNKFGYDKIEPLESEFTCNVITKSGVKHSSPDDEAFAEAVVKINELVEAVNKLNK